MIQKGKAKATAGKEKRTYRVSSTGWIAGRWREAGDLIELTAAQAKYVNVELVSTSDQAPSAASKRKASGADA